MNMVGGAMMSFLLRGSLPLLLLCALLQVLPSHTAEKAPDYGRMLESYAEKGVFAQSWDYNLVEFQVLGRSPDPAILPVLHAGVTAPKARVRLAAVWLLGLRGDAEAFPLLLGLLHDPNAAVRARAVSWLPPKDPHTLELIYAALQDPATEVRQTAYFRLEFGLLPDVETAEHLLPLLHDADATLRQHAAWRLAAYRDPKLIPALAARLAEPDCPPGVWEALGQHGDSRVIPVLISLLAGWRGEDDESREGDLAETASDELVDLQTTLPVAEPLLQALKSNDAGLRAGAAYTLGRIDDPRAVPALLAALGDPHKPVRLAVLQALALQFDARGYQAVLPLLNEQDADIRCAAADALLLCQDARMLPPLKRMLSSEDLRERLAAARTLSLLSHPQVMPLLTRALGDPERDVRQAAIEGCCWRTRDRRTLEAMVKACESDSSLMEELAELLACYPPETARPVLLRALKVKDPWRREQAASLLEKYPAPEVTTALLVAMTDADGDVREAASGSLAELADPAMLPGLVKLLDHPLYAGEKRDVLIDLLGDAGPGSADVLFKLLAVTTPNDELRNNLFTALQHTGDPRVVDALIGGVNSKSVWDAADAADGLGELGDPRAIPSLIEALGREDWARNFVAKALGKLQAREAVEPLSKLLAEGDRSQAIFLALRDIGDPRAVEALLPLLNVPPGTLIDNSSVIEALGALRRLGDPRAAVPALSLLKRFLYDERADTLCVYAVEALSTLPAEAARNEAKAFLRAEQTPRAAEVLRYFEPGYEVDEWLVKARAIPRWLDDPSEPGTNLGEIRDGKERERLTGLAHSDSWRARWAAVYALAENNEPWALDSLTKLLTDPQPLVRAAAVNALSHARGETLDATLAWARRHPRAEIRKAAEELQRFCPIFGEYTWVGRPTI